MLLLRYDAPYRRCALKEFRRYEGCAYRNADDGIKFMEDVSTFRASRRNNTNSSNVDCKKFIIISIEIGNVCSLDIMYTNIASNFYIGRSVT